MIEFGRKMTNLLCNPAHLSIFNRKATQIKRALNRKFPQKNTISEAKTIEFGRKTMNLQ